MQVFSVVSCDCTSVLPQVVEVCVLTQVVQLYTCPKSGGATLCVLVQIVHLYACLNAGREIA